MAESDKKISQLPEALTLQPDDYLLVVTNTTVDPTSKRIKPRNVFGTVASNVSVTGATNISETLTTNNLIISSDKIKMTKSSPPANSAVSDGTIAIGSIFYDDDYLYIKTSSGVIKRIALQVF